MKDYTQLLPISSPRQNIEHYVPGRRFRAMLRIIHTYGEYIAIDNDHIIKVENPPQTYGQLYELFRNYDLPIPLRMDLYNRSVDNRTITAETFSTQPNPSLHVGLQDLAFEFFMDIHEACAAFNDPTIYYVAPSAEEIEPVTDDHVHLVIAGIERELQRELRPRNTFSNVNLPYAPLHTLSFPIQRALVERRRYRFLQWGITKEHYLKNEWYLCNVQEDVDWLPRSQCE
jgi:hypothetical protein